MRHSMSLHRNAAHISILVKGDAGSCPGPCGDIMNSYDKDTWNVKSDPFEKLNKKNKRSSTFGQTQSSVFDMPEKEKRSFSQVKKDAQKYLSDEDKNPLSTLAKSFSERTSEYQKRSVNNTGKRAQDNNSQRKMLGIVGAVIVILISLISEIAEPAIDNLFDDQTTSDSSYYTEYPMDEMLNTLATDPEEAKSKYYCEFISSEGYVLKRDESKNQVTLVPDSSWDGDCVAICNVYDYISAPENSPIDADNDGYTSVSEIPDGTVIEFNGFVSEVRDKEYIIDVNEITDAK